MIEPGVPNEVEQFIGRHIRSIEQLEVLLLLSANAQRTWTAEAVQSEIQSSLPSIRERLQELTNQGFLSIAQEPVYQFTPASAEIAQVVVALAKAYKQRRIRVIELIFSRPNEDLRSFSDAFKLRKDKDHG